MRAQDLEGFGPMRGGDWRLTLYGGDQLAGHQAQEPPARVEALDQGGRQTEGAGQQAGDRQVEDEQIARVAVSSSA